MSAFKSYQISELFQNLLVTLDTKSGHWSVSFVSCITLGAGVGSTLQSAAGVGAEISGIETIITFH